MLLIRRIRELLYEEGFTISGARNRLDHSASTLDESPSLARAPASPPAAPAPSAFDVTALKQALRDVIDALRH